MFGVLAWVVYSLLGAYLDNIFPNSYGGQWIALVNGAMVLCVYMAIPQASGSL